MKVKNKNGYLQSNQRFSRRINFNGIITDSKPAIKLNQNNLSNNF